MKTGIKIAAIGISLLTANCASQMHMKQKSLEVPGVGVVTAVSIESQNGLSNNLKVIKTYGPDGKETGAYSHGNDGIMYPLLSGAIAAGGQIGAAAVWPEEVHETNQVGGGAYQEQVQDQVQDQMQDQTQDQLQLQEQSQKLRNNNRVNNANVNFNNNNNSNKNTNFSSSSSYSKSESDDKCRR